MTNYEWLIAKLASLRPEDIAEGIERFGDGMDDIICNDCEASSRPCYIDGRCYPCLEWLGREVGSLADTDRKRAVLPIVL